MLKRKRDRKLMTTATTTATLESLWRKLLNELRKEEGELKTYSKTRKVSMTFRISIENEIYVYICRFTNVIQFRIRIKQKQHQTSRGRSTRFSHFELNLNLIPKVRSSLTFEYGRIYVGRPAARAITMKICIKREKRNHITNGLRPYKRKTKESEQYWERDTTHGVYIYNLGGFKIEMQMFFLYIFMFDPSLRFRFTQWDINMFHIYKYMKESLPLPLHNHCRKESYLYM